MRKIANVILLFTCFLFSYCSPTEAYHGYVYDGLTRKPLTKVLVKERLPANAKFTYTDAKGYFRIENKKQSFTDLIFSLDKYQVDTFPSIWSQHGETLKYTFLNHTPDTVFLMLKDSL